MKFYYFLPLILMCITTSQLLFIILPAIDIESRGVTDLRGQDVGSTIINNEFQIVPPLRNINYNSPKVTSSETKTSNEIYPNRIKDEGGSTLTKLLLTESVDNKDMGFVWLDAPDEVDLGTTYGGWVQQDLSDDSVPSYAEGVILAWVETSVITAGHAVARGSEDPTDYMRGGCTDNKFEEESWRMQIVKLGSHKYIDTYRNSSAEKLYVMGYTIGSDPHYYTVPVILGSLTADSSWHTLTINGLQSNTTGLVLFGQSTSTSDAAVLVRAIGSTDNMVNREWEELNNGLLFVQIDSNDQFEYYITSGGNATIYLVAEVSSTIDWLDTNRDEVSLGSIGWTTVDLDDYVTVPISATGVILQHEVGDLAFSDFQNIARKAGETWEFPNFDVGLDQWLLGGSGFDSQHRIEIYEEFFFISTYIHALTCYNDLTPPEVISLGVDDPGTGVASFWAEVTDSWSSVENVTIRVNNTDYSMSYNGSYWINNTVPIEYGCLYEYQLINASDIFGNKLVNPSPEINYIFINDVLPPTVVRAEYDQNIGLYGAFNANVTDNWGEIDSVMLNVTYFGGLARNGYLTIMRNTTSGYINDTIDIPNGLVKFTIIVNDTQGNAFTSEEFLGYKGVNSPPKVENITLSPDPVHSNQSLTLSYDFEDTYGDSEGGTQIRWYKDYVLQNFFNDSMVIPSFALIKGELWYATIRPKDGQLFGNPENSSTITVLNSAPKITDYSFTFGNPAIPGVLVEDEDIKISYYFIDVDPFDPDLSVIKWYIDENWKSQYDGMTTISADETQPGETWRVEFRPYDGVEYGRLVTLSILIESRPTINSVNFIPINDTEGHYELEFNITDTRNEIQQVEFYLYLNSTDALPAFIITSPKNGVPNLWMLDYYLTDYSYLNTLTLMNVTIITEVTYTLTYEISLTQNFNFTILDTAPPQVISAWFEKDNDENPTSLIFYAEIDERGSGISEITLFYYFTPSETGGEGSSLRQELSVSMVFERMIADYYLYSVTVDIGNYNTDLNISYHISTTDNDGNISNLAFVNSALPEQRISYTPPGLPEWLVIVGILIIFVIFVGAVAYVRFIRKPELVGLDKELVMKSISQITDIELLGKMEHHTIGGVISFFDQRYGPIPIVIHPEMLKDNFSKLVDLSDRSFASTGFTNNFTAETISSYDYVLDQDIIVVVISFGFSLEKPEARGGQENITFNLLIYQDLFNLLNQFLDEIKAQVHDLHMLMTETTTKKDQLIGKIYSIRKFVSRIILSYELLYGTTELIEDE